MHQDNVVAKSEWARSLIGIPKIGKRVLIAVDVSASTKDATTLFGHKVITAQTQLIRAIKEAKADIGNLAIVAFDWKGFWNINANFVYVKNPHGDLMPAGMKETAGIYEPTMINPTNDEISAWLWKTGGVPRVNLCLPLNWAQERREAFDRVIFLTDNKSIYGAVPDDAWHQYTQVVGLQPKIANVCLSKSRYDVDKKTGQCSDNLWLSPFFANFTADSLSQLWHFINTEVTL